MIQLKGINIDGMMRYSYDCPYCDYCLWVYVQPLTGRLVKVKKAEKELNLKVLEKGYMTKDKYYIKIRDSVLKKIKKKYTDIPKRFHDTPTSSTSGDLFIDEIAWLTIKKMLHHFKLSSNKHFLRKDEKRKTKIF